MPKEPTQLGLMFGRSSSSSDKSNKTETSHQPHSRSESESQDPRPAQGGRSTTRAKPETDADFRDGGVQVPAPGFFETGWEAAVDKRAGGFLSDLRDASRQIGATLFDLPERGPFDREAPAMAPGVGAKSGPTDLPVGADDLVPTEPPVGTKEELAEYSFVRRKLGGVVHDYFPGPEEIDHAYVEIEVVERLTIPGAGAEDRRGEWDSVPSLIARMGAKSILAEWLVERVPRHHTWVEPFMGSCKVLFAKKQRSRIEIINDFDGDLVSFFRYVQYRPDELARFINSIPTHEAIVLGLREALGDRRLRGIQRAAAFYLGSQSAFNSKGDYSSYASSPQVKLDLSIDVAAVRKVADRLRGVDIRSTGYRRVIESANKRMGPAYHGPVFFYCDPPYWQTAGYATLQGESSFSWGDQVALADLMKEVTDAGNLFVITNSGHPDLYRIYKERGFFIEEREVYYSVSGDAEARKKSKEYIVSNFRLEGAKRQGGLFG